MPERGLAFLVGMIMSISVGAQTPPAPLVLEAKIPLGQVNGRIDHLAVDLQRQRLFVAELGNNTLGVIDLSTKTLLRRITGLSEPQGVAYEPITDAVYVANARDGSVNVLRGEDLSALDRVDLVMSDNVARRAMERAHSRSSIPRPGPRSVTSSSRGTRRASRLTAIVCSSTCRMLGRLRSPISRRARSSALGRRSRTTQIFRWRSIGMHTGSSWCSGAQPVLWSCRRPTAALSSASTRAATPMTCSSMRSATGSM